ncbi:carbamoylphosphate synthase small subunit [Zymobacter palmae]|uniref:Carbamoylphosphate synthase small subunit n=1 Tax=Zymobacter palmae TaxID=33074 RepID=A0A348HEF7_9GAMM|nr:carbamoylphosphate synthase small subunit [Zymobacter palmae]
MLICPGSDRRRPLCAKEPCHGSQPDRIHAGSNTAYPHARTRYSIGIENGCRRRTTASNAGCAGHQCRMLSMGSRHCTRAWRTTGGLNHPIHPVQAVWRRLPLLARPAYAAASTHSLCIQRQRRHPQELAHWLGNERLIEQCPQPQSGHFLRLVSAAVHPRTAFICWLDTHLGDAAHWHQPDVVHAADPRHSSPDTATASCQRHQMARSRHGRSVPLLCCSSGIRTALASNPVMHAGSVALPAFQRTDHPAHSALQFTPFITARFKSRQCVIRPGVFCYRRLYLRRIPAGQRHRAYKHGPPPYREEQALHDNDNTRRRPDR